MEFDKLNDVLRKQAIRCGLCQKWQDTVWNRNMTQDELFALFFRGIDFCITKGFPDKKTVRALFSTKTLRDNSVLVDDHYSLLNPPKAVLIGRSSTVSRYNGYSVSELYLTDDSEAEVYTREKAHVIIHQYGQSSAKVHAYDQSHVLSILHSEEAVCEAMEGQVTIKEDSDS